MPPPPICCISHFTPLNPTLQTIFLSVNTLLGFFFNHAKGLGAPSENFRFVKFIKNQWQLPVL